MCNHHLISFEEGLIYCGVKFNRKISGGCGLKFTPEEYKELCQAQIKNAKTIKKRV